MEQILFSVIQTLNGVEVKGKDNIEKIYCSIIALENLAAEIQRASEEAKENNNG